MIKAENITFSYGKYTIVENLNLLAEAGECVVLAGPNGSGKSTVLAMLAGALKPSSGSIECDGKIGYIPQGTALLEDATVEENLRFFAKLAHCVVPEKLPFSIDSYRDKRVSKLSGGMKKQVSIACALMGDPAVVMLDEPCAALDMAFRDEMIETVEKWKREGRTVVYVGHDPAEFYRFFDTLVFFDNPVRTIHRKDIPEASEVEIKFTEFFKHELSNIKRK